MSEPKQPTEAAGGRSDSTAVLGTLPHDVARCCGYSYHHTNCGKRDDCRRFNERDDLGFMTTNYLMAPDDCENGCGYLIPEPHH